MSNGYYGSIQQSLEFTAIDCGSNCDRLMLTQKFTIFSDKSDIFRPLSHNTKQI